MSISGFIKALWQRRIITRERKAALQIAGPENISPNDWKKSLSDPNGFYLDCFRFFHQRLSLELREHRSYFTSERRGFGEDAFHVMWYFLFREFRPKNFVEIGVYRGQTLSLATLLSRMNNFPTEIIGISPFSGADDSMCKYLKSVDYYKDTLANFDRFKLPAPQLLRAFSTDPEAERFISSKQWEMVYIDGNHDYEIVKRDWENCSTNLKAGGIIVIDDSGLTTSFRPPVFATGGFPGPSKLAQEIDRKHFRELVQVGHNRVFQKLGANEDRHSDD